MAVKKKPLKLKALSPAAQAAIKDKKLEGSDSFKNWQKCLAELEAFDAHRGALYRRADSQIGMYILLAFLWIFGGILASVLGGIFLGQAGLLLIAGAVVLLVVLIVMAVVNSKRASRLKAADLSDDFSLCLIPFLDELAEDCDPKAKVRLKLNLSGLTDPKVLSKRGLPTPAGRPGQVYEFVYQDPWCHLALPLNDGNIITMDLKNYVIKQVRSWHNARGKPKSKAKWRKTVIAVASLAPGQSEAAWDPTKLDRQPEQGKLRLADKKGAKVARLVKKWKFKCINFEPNDPVPVEELMGMFMQLYALLKPAAGTGT